MTESGVKTEVPDDPVRCPKCKTTRLKVLKKLDRIEKLYGNALMNKIRARRGDTIYHCVVCRLQFYDSRKPVAGPAPVPQVDKSAQANTPEKLKSTP